MERKNYKFSNGIEAYQEELTLEQDYKLAELAMGIDLNSFKDLDKLEIKNVLKLLVNENVLEKFLQIILIPLSEITDKTFNSLKNSEVKQVIEDFFTLNPLVRDLLQNLSSGLATETKSPKSFSSETSAENTKPDF